MNNNFSSLSNYESVLKEYNKQLGSSQYLFLIKKCCGYSFLFPFHREATISEFYRFIGYELKPSNPIHLYLNHELLCLKKEIPPLDVSLRDYLKDPIDNKLIKPLYKIPAPVVYELYLDDGNHSGCQMVLE